MLQPLRSGFFAFLLALGVLAGTACARLDPTRDPQSPTPVPKVAFSDLTLEETGGIDGRHNVLLVRTDGVALSMSWKPAAGQLSPDTVTRLRTLLESEHFRIEVARGGEPEPPQCSDQITMRLVMSALAISQTGPCPTDAAPTPAFDEILKILSAPLRGEFDRPVAGGEPRLVPIRLEAQADGGKPAHVITVDARGRVVKTTRGSTTVRRTLEVGEQDTLRLLLDRLQSVPPVDCAKPGRYRAVIGGKTTVTVVECDYSYNQPELRAVVNLLEW
jgi:hypothetical protein